MSHITDNMTEEQQVAYLMELTKQEAANNGGEMGSILTDDRVSQLQDECAEKDNALAEKDLEIAKLRSELQRVKVGAGAGGNVSDEFTSSVRDLHATLAADTKRMLEHEQKEKLTLQKRITTMERGIDILKGRLLSAITKEKEFQDVRKNYEQEKTELRLKLQEKLSDVDDLEMSVRTLQENNHEIEEYKKRLVHIERELRTKDDRNTRANSEIEQLKTQFEALSQEKQDLLKDYTTMRNDHLEALNQSNREIATRDQKLKNLEEASMKQKEVISELRHEVSSATANAKTSEEVKQIITTLQASIKKNEDVKAKQSQNNLALQERIDKLIEENNKLLDDYVELNSQYDVLDHKFTVMQGKLREAEMKNTRYEKRLAQ